MAKKDINTTCAALEWSDFLFLVEALKRKGEYSGLMILCTGVYLGLRVSDIKRIRWRDLLSKQQFEIIEKKTGKKRSITMNTAFAELITFIFKSNQYSENDFIAANKKGKPLSIQYINRMLHQIFEENKINAGNGSSHTLRKTFGRRVWLLNQKSESSLILLSKVFNHSNTGITRTYLGITSDEISGVYLNL